MRRFLFSLAAGFVLAGTTARTATADVKEYLDCVKFTTVWCDLTRDEVENIIEYMAVEFWCGVQYLRCAVVAF